MMLRKKTLIALKWAFILILGALVLAAIVVLSPSSAPAYSHAEISRLVDKIHYNAAIDTPHLSLGKKTRTDHLELFEKVEQGRQLTAPEAARYRVLYQSILYDNQRYLSFFDGGLTVVHNHGMKENNNVATLGIDGSHDHHDFSALSNFNSLKTALSKLESAAGPTGLWERISSASCAYKDLTDIILHMATAPQTKSTPYHANGGDARIDNLFDDVMRHYKAAQFEPVNSPAYVASIHAALASYDQLVSHVQERVNGKLTPWEQAVAGRWLSWRSFGPALEDKQAGPFARASLPSPPAAAQ